MSDITESITFELLSWSGVIVKPHRYGGLEFHFENNEIGHIHNDKLVDFLFPLDVRNELVNTRRASPHHIYPKSGWISLMICTPDNVINAINLLRMKYELLHSAIEH